MKPKLRFHGFEGKWVEKRFFKLFCKVIDFRGRTPLKLGMEWGGGNILSLSANNVKNGYIAFNSECNLGSDTLYQRWMKGSEIKKKDIIFTMEAPLGKALIIRESVKYILSQRVVAFRTNEDTNPFFLLQVIWSLDFQSKLEKLSTGSTAKGINQKSLKKIKILLPSLHEQQKIADFLTVIDNKIQKLTQKKDAYSQYKKGLLQKLFPKAGEIVPELRFPGFEGVWVENRLGEISRIIDGDRGVNYPNGDDFFPEGYCLFMNAKNVTKYGFSFEESMFITKSKDESLRKGRLEREDLVLTTRGSVGHIAYFDQGVPYENMRINSGMVIIRCNQSSTNINFIYKMIGSTMFKIQINRISFGSAQPQLTVKEINLFKIVIPGIEEQQKIADFLTTVDKKITQVDQQIKTMTQFKKGLLQQMFV